MRLRLILAFILVALVPIVAITVFARLSVASQVETYMTSGGMVGLDELVSSLKDYYTAHQSWQGADSLLQSVHGGQGRGLGMGGMMNQRLRLIDAEGVLVFDTAGLQTAGQRVSASLLAEAVQMKDARGKIIGYLWAEGGLGTNLGGGQRLVQRLNNISLLAGGIALVLAVILALLVGSGLARPMQQLELAARRMAEGDLSQRVQVQGNDELATLGQSFNHMAASLQESEARRQAMTADIAHELRTPLAVQRAQLEAMQDGIYPMTAANLQVALDQNTTLARLVEDLRTLALADARELKLESIAVDLQQLAIDVVARFQPAARERSIDLVLNPKSERECPRVMGDPLRIEQILNNVLANALRFTPENGRVDLSIDCSERFVQVSVHDGGPGITPEALPHLFERFYRADRARSREQGGTGLGLAIARQLAELMGGTLTAANHEHGGAIFDLRFPSA
ncbi:signal transduction histidine kinase [Longilinea arvoryzae]|uniref:histidine kinase n=1 Tax=Longilinea arvoryzae TaxID=360412 RepID=A0A0S7BHL6_9CHLR|nr:ATP-binding protein [Longilinea arvoryzae]GAP15081.1 signal transduction histidine kinase [Longilinea arvoryzae]